MIQSSSSKIGYLCNVSFKMTVFPWKCKPAFETARGAGLTSDTISPTEPPRPLKSV
jgi:hypothetical protein